MIIKTSKKRKRKIGINNERLSVLDRTTDEKRIPLNKIENIPIFKAMAAKYKNPNWSL